MALGPTPDDSQRLMSDPTRYGGEPPYPPPGAVPGAIPAPGAMPPAAAPQPMPQQPPPMARAPVPAGAAPAGAPPALTPPERTRPQQDSGYYQKPDPETLGDLIKRGLDKITGLVSGTDGQGVGGPAVGRDPRADVASNAYARNVMAPTPQDMDAAYKASDPEGKLSTDELQLKTLQDATDYWLANGRPDRAANAAAGVLLYGKKVASTMGFMAITAIKDGNMERAAQLLQKGYGYIPDGRSAQYEVGPDGQVQFWFIDAEGNASNKQVLTPEIASNLGTAMANGSGWLNQLLLASGGGGKGGRGGLGTPPDGAGTPGQQKTQAQAEALQAVNTAADALQEARESGDAERIKQAEDNFKTTVTSGMAVPGLGPQVQRLAGLTMPDVYGPKGGRGGGKVDPAVKLNEDVTKAEGEIDTKIAAENDPQKKATLTAQKQFIRPFLTYSSRPDVKKIDESRLDAQLGETATGPYAEYDGPTKQVMRMTAAAILRKSNESAETVIGAIDAAMKGAKANVLPDGRIQIAGFPAVYMDAYIFGQLRALRQNYMKANPNATPPAASAAPSTPSTAPPAEDDGED